MPISFTRAVAPTPLEYHPDVRRHLLAAGFGNVEVEARYRGRHENWVVTSTTGDHLFVKKFLGQVDDVHRRLRRTIAAHSLLHHGVSSFAVPDLRSVDSEAGIAVFSYVGSATSAAEQEANDGVRIELAAAFGRMMAELHHVDGSALLESCDPFDFPKAEWCGAIPLEIYEEGAGGELEVLSLLQGDHALRAAFARLQKDEQEQPVVLCHGDLRLDQFMWATDRWWLVDWEEARLGDAARDLAAMLAAMLGEWVHRGVARIAAVTTLTDHAEIDRAIMDEGSRGLDWAVPYMVALWTSYQAARPQVDGRVLRRAFGLAGWHLMERILALASRRNQISGYDRALLGIGRSLLLEPSSLSDLISEGS